MKIAEALMARSALKQQVSTLSRAAMSNATSPSDEPAVEDPNELINQALEMEAELEAISNKINVTNHLVSINAPDGEMLLAQAIARRDRYGRQSQLVAKLVESARGEGRGLGYQLRRRDVPSTVNVDIGELRRRADELAKKFSDFNVAIQQANWDNDIVED